MSNEICKVLIVMVLFWYKPIVHKSIGIYCPWVYLKELPLKLVQWLRATFHTIRLFITLA